MKKVMFVLWFLLLSIPLSLTMGMHSLSLNASKNLNLNKLAEQKNAKWTKLHFLGSDCACSEKVYSELLKRKPDTSNEERIFIIGKNEVWKTELLKKGFNVTEANMDEFEKIYSIKAVPQLVVVNENKKIIYSGGYAAHRNPASIEDEEIVQALKGKKSVDERPIFGCVSGSVNRKNSDPFKLKY
jgi:thioredoxin-related protein